MYNVVNIKKSTGTSVYNEIQIWKELIRKHQNMCHKKYFYEIPRNKEVMNSSEGIKKVSIKE